MTDYIQQRANKLIAAINDKNSTEVIRNARHLSQTSRVNLSTGIWRELAIETGKLAEAALLVAISNYEDFAVREYQQQLKDFSVQLGKDLLHDAAMKRVMNHPEYLEDLKAHGMRGATSTFKRLLSIELAQ